MTVIDQLMNTLATLRKTTVDVIKAELAADNAETHDQLFKLACAFEACK